MPIRAKFRCLEVAKRYSHTTAAGIRADGHVYDAVDVFNYRVKLAPVMGKKSGTYDPCEENKKFFAATPSGEIEMTMVSEAAAAAFTPGQAYYIDFTPTDG